MVAADGTRDRCRVTDGSELEWFERLPAPNIHAHTQPWHQVLQPRYVVFHRGNAVQSTHQEYVGRRGMQIRPGVRVCPRYPSVVYAWDTELPPGIADALRRRAARIGYLGAADSPVRLRVGTTIPEPVAAEDVFQPDAGGDLEINIPVAGDVRMLDAMYDQWVERGASVARAQFPALRHQIRYRSSLTPAVEEAGSVVAWLRLGKPVSGRRVTPITTLFKQAVLSRHQAIHGEPPALLHGHGFSGNGYELARFLALPDVGYPRSRGRIHGLALWLPAGCDSVVHQRIRDAAFAVRHLTGYGLDVPVAPLGQRDAATRCESEPLDADGALLGDRLPGAARTPRPPRSAGSVALVQACGAAGAGSVPVGAFASGARRERPRPGRSEPAGQNGAALLTRRPVVRHAGAWTGRDWSGQAAQPGALRPR